MNHTQHIGMHSKNKNQCALNLTNNALNEKCQFGCFCYSFVGILTSHQYLLVVLPFLIFDDLLFFF